MTRVILAGLFHETNTFVPEPTRLEDFTVTTGADLLACKDDGSPLAGFLTAAERYSWEVVPTADFRAMPGGTVTDESVEAFWRAFAGPAQAALGRGVEAIFFVLHGAMVSASLRDVEGDMLARVRALPGAAALPLFGVLDLHANVTARMAAYADALVAYRENPHTDAFETGLRAAALLQSCLGRGRRPRTFWRKAGLLWPPTATATSDLPMRALLDCARQLEAEHPSLWEVGVLSGFAHADTPDTGVGFTVVGDGSGDDVGAAAEALTRLEQLALAQPVPEPPELPLHETLDRVLPVRGGLVLLVEPADNIGGGAPGDVTSTLHALLERRAAEALVVLNDPEAAARAGAAVGAEISLQVGGRSPFGPGPVALSARVLSASSGRFRLEDPQSHLASMYGQNIDMGPCAVALCGGVTVLLTSRKTPPFDLGQLRSQGLEPTAFKLITVKAAVAHRRAYDPIAKESYAVDVPGPCTSDLSRLEYRFRAP